jgi:hypothetical protein
MNGPFGFTPPGLELPVARVTGLNPITREAIGGRLMDILRTHGLPMGSRDGRVLKSFSHFSNHLLHLPREEGGEGMNCQKRLNVRAVSQYHGTLHVASNEVS